MNRSLIISLLSAAALVVIGAMGASTLYGQTATSTRTRTVTTNPQVVTPPPVAPDYRTEYCP